MNAFRNKIISLLIFVIVLIIHTTDACGKMKSRFGLDSECVHYDVNGNCDDQNLSIFYG